MQLKRAYDASFPSSSPPPETFILPPWFTEITEENTKKISLCSLPWNVVNGPSVIQPIVDESRRIELESRGLSFFAPTNKDNTFQPQVGGYPVSYGPVPKFQSIGSILTKSSAPSFAPPPPHVGKRSWRESSFPQGPEASRAKTGEDIRPNQPYVSGVFSKDGSTTLTWGNALAKKLQVANAGGNSSPATQSLGDFFDEQPRNLLLTKKVLQRSKERSLNDLLKYSKRWTLLKPR